MNWIIPLIFGALIAAVFLMKKANQISVADAAKHLKNGAVVIDVRSPSEFASGRLPNAINIPLEQIELTVPKRVKDKSQPILLHCATGMRSGMAQAKLKSLGYTNVHNLGSFSRAESILKQTGTSN